MSHLIARILLTILMLPSAAVVYAAIFAVARRQVPYNVVSYDSRRALLFVGTGVVVWGLVVVYWLLLWRRSVRWTAARRGLSWLAAAGATVAAVVLAGPIYFLTRDEDFAAFIASVFAPLAWLVGSIFVWRETREERAARIRTASADALVCPLCGYNLTGLSEASCPECGAKFTLNDLFAAQPSREAVSAEREMVAP